MCAPVALAFWFDHFESLKLSPAIHAEAHELSGNTRHRGSRRCGDTPLPEVATILRLAHDCRETCPSPIADAPSVTVTS